MPFTWTELWLKVYQLAISSGNLITIFYFVFRNGHSLGLAFSDIRRGKGYAYFPAISLSFAEVVQLNFGGTPFRSVFLLKIFDRKSTP